MDDQDADGGLAWRVVRRIGTGVRPLPLLLVVLAAVEPFVGFLDQNQGEYLQVGDLVQATLATVLLAMAVYAALLVAMPHTQPARIAACVAVFTFWFFRYGPLLESPTRSVVLTLALWAVSALVLVAVVAVWSRYTELRLFLVVFLAVMTMQPALPLIGFIGSDAPSAGAAGAAESDPIAVTDDAARTPDVWWLLLDQYDRQDVLDTVFGYDNSAFVGDLEARGFEVADQSYTSYPATPLAVSSVLNMDYAEEADGFLRDGFSAETGPLGGGGRVVDALASHGYRHLYADNGVFDWATCDEGVADACLGRSGGLLDGSDVFRTVADLTPLAALRSEHRPDPVQIVRDAQAEMDPDRPEFVFGHVLSPHEPYWYDGDCDFRARPVRGDFDAERYLRQVTCLNPRVLEAVDAITENDPDAIVIIQSDHGSEALSSPDDAYEDWTPEALAERYAILEAMRLPEGCAVPEGVHANVSTFEYVLACIEGRPAEPLEDRFFYWQWSKYEEVTEIDAPVGGRAG